MLEQRSTEPLGGTPLAASLLIFDSSVEWSGGPYELLWIDVADNVGVFYKLTDGGSIGRIDSTVANHRRCVRSAWGVNAQVLQLFKQLT